MANRYSKVQTSLWTSDKFNAAKEFSRIVYMYLLSCPHGNSAGLFKLPEGYAITDLKCSQQRYRNALSDLQSVGLIEYEGDIVFVRQFLRFNPYTNPSHAKGSRNEIEGLEAHVLYKFFHDDLSTHCPDYINCFLEPVESLSRACREGDSTKTLTYTETNKETKTDSAPAREGFDSFWQAYPKKKAKGDAEKAFSKLKPDDELLKTMLEAIKAQSRSPDWTKDGGQFIPYPATWINQRRWEDEVSSPQESKYNVTEVI